VQAPAEILVLGGQPRDEVVDSYETSVELKSGSALTTIKGGKWATQIRWMGDEIG
jgi:hypothetical protein